MEYTQLAAGNLLGLPWRVALALQADGWWLRSDVIWAKALSFCPTYSGSTMPESVNGWRWERCRVKVKGCQREGPNADRRDGGQSDIGNQEGAQWADCPGCPKCEKNGGLVLRRGSWRCTKAHEYLFMLTRSERYFCDMEAVKEDVSTDTHSKGNKLAPPIDSAGIGHADWHKYTPEIPSGRNLRDVWCINPQAYKGAHYATFPEKLVEPCIKVSTSQRGVCPKCGAPWARVVKRMMDIPRNETYEGKQVGQDKNFSHKRIQMLVKKGREMGLPHDNTVVPMTTLGWRPTCDCIDPASPDPQAPSPVPALCYDPFMGSGTTAAVAARLGRNYCGSELSAKYLTEQAAIRVKAAEHGMDMAEIEQGQQALFGDKEL